MHILIMEDVLDLGTGLQQALRVEGVSSQWLRRIADVPLPSCIEADCMRWTLTVAVPVLDPWWIASTMSGGLTIDMLIALPFVLLPLWFAVSRGLRPLLRLSAQIAARDADDLAPLGVTPRYAELRPLTDALEQLLAQLRNKVERAQAGRSLIQAIARASHLIRQLLDLAQMDRPASLAPAQHDVAQLLRQELASLALAGGFQLSVADDGPGIAASQCSLVFERFYRGGHHEAPGAGLGMAIMREASKRLHGSVELADGIDGKGCCFIVTIIAPTCLPQADSHS